MQARASALETQISRDIENEQVAGERYDQAHIALAADQAKLTRIKKDLRLEQRRIVVARAKVQRAAVTAYVYGVGSQAEIEAVLSGHNLADAKTLATYAGVATDQLRSAVLSLGAAELRLATGEHQQVQVTAAAAASTEQAAAAQTAAEQNAAVTKADLSQVKGQLAQLIAQQEAAAAAAAAARARAAVAQERAQAQAQAQTDAALAQTVAGSNPGAVTSTAAAQAAISAAIANGVGAPSINMVGSTPAGLLAVAKAESYLGVPYVWGGADSSGFDCSGLTMVAWNSAGAALLHSAWYQYTETSRVSLDALEPGDLLFYQFPNDGSDPVTHVAMYVGSGPYGVDTVIQAPETGETVSYAPIYFAGFVGAGRPIVVTSA